MEDTVSVHELKRLIETDSVRLIDVLPPEDFELRHIPGSKNACVYEMVFMDQIFDLLRGWDGKVVVYDYSGTTIAAKTAKAKLEQSGYHNVAVLKGGLQAWQAAGYVVEHSVTADEAPAEVDGVYLINQEKSVLEWSGRNINNRHHGRISIIDSSVILEDGRPILGQFELDMNTLTNIDILDDNWRAMLLRHLKSEDFFDVEHYPTVIFELRGAAPISGSTPGTPNMEIAGILTIKGTAHSICFPAVVVAQEDGSIKAQASINFDRTFWNVNYGSGKLFERLGMHLVHDFVSVELFIVARKPGTAAC